MRQTILLIWMAFTTSVLAAEPTPVPKPEVRQPVQQLPQSSSKTAPKTSVKRTDVKESHDRHANVERALPSPKPSPKRPAATTNVVSNQKPAPTPKLPSKVKTSEKQQQAVERLIRD